MADNFQIELVGSLDQATTIKNINYALQKIAESSKLGSISLNIKDIKLSKEALNSLNNLQITPTISGFKLDENGVKTSITNVGRMISKDLSAAIGQNVDTKELRAKLKDQLSLIAKEIRSNKLSGLNSFFNIGASADESETAKLKQLTKAYNSAVSEIANTVEALDSQSVGFEEASQRISNAISTMLSTGSGIDDIIQKYGQLKNVSADMTDVYSNLLKEFKGRTLFIPNAQDLDPSFGGIQGINQTLFGRGIYASGKNTKGAVDFNELADDLLRIAGIDISDTTNDMDKLNKALSLLMQASEKASELTPVSEYFGGDYRYTIDNMLKIEGLYKEATSAKEAYDTVVANSAAAQAQATAEFVTEEEKKQEAVKETQAAIKQAAASNMSFFDMFAGYKGSFEEAKASLKAMAEDEKAVVTISQSLDNQGQLTGFTASIQRATGEIEKLRFGIDEAGEQFELLGGSSNDSVARNVNRYSKELNRLQTQYSKTDYDFSGLSKALDDYRQGTIDLRQLSEAYEQVTKEVNEYYASLKSKDVSLDPIQQALNEMRNMPTVLNELEAGINTLKDSSQITISIDKLRASYEKLNQAIITDKTTGQQILPFNKEWTDSYSVLSATIKDLEKNLKSLQAAEARDNSGKTASGIKTAFSDGSYYADVQRLNSQLQNFGIENETAARAVNDLNTAYNNLSNSIGKDDKTLVLAMDEYSRAVTRTKNALTVLRAEHAKVNEFANRKLSNDIDDWLRKNTKAAKDYGYVLEEIKQQTQGADKITLKNLKQQFDDVKRSAAEAGKLGKTFGESIKEMGEKFASWITASGIVMQTVSRLRTAVEELKEVNTLITEISKANDKLSHSQLAEIASSSFDIASKYGKNSTDYLLAVQEASRAGYDSAMGIAELSVAAQGAGDMTAELSNQYIIATDKAWKLNGSVSALTKVLDGSNYITNRNAVNMTELSEAMSIAGSTAASFGVDTDEATAALGTMIATTQQSGQEAARAFRSILLNIRQVSDEEEGIDAEGLTKYEKACNALNVKLKETKNGVLQLRDPMEVLKELSIEYNKLSESDIRRTNLLSSVGGKLRATQLDALLRQWSMYEKMLAEYSQGAGSMAAEAEKTASSWEGSLNRLSNTWTDTIGNIANSDDVITVINNVNNLLAVVNELTDKAGSFPSLGAIAGLITALKGGGAVNYTKSGLGGWLPAVVNNLQATKKLMPAVTSEAKEFFEVIQSGNKPLSAYSKITGIADQSLVEFLNDTSRSGDTFEDYQKWLLANGKTTQQYTSFTQTATFALKTFLATAANMLIFAAIGKVVSLAYENIVKGQENVIEKGREAAQTIQDLRNQLQSNTNTVNELKDEYAQLSKGVNVLGENVGLTSEEYKRYHEITNQIADMFPELVRGYDDEGNAILKVKDNVESLTEALKEQQQAYRDNLITASKDVFSAFDMAVNPQNTLLGIIQQDNGKGALKDQEKYLIDYLKQMDAGAKKITTGAVGSIQTLLKDAGIEFSQGAEGTIKFENSTENKRKIQAELRKIQREIETQVRTVVPTVQAIIEDSTEYQALSETGKKMADAVIQGYDDEFYLNKDINSVPYEIIDNFVAKMDGWDNRNIGKNFEKLIDLQGELSTGTTNWETYSKAVNEFLKEIDDFDPETKKVIRLMFLPQSSNGETVESIQSLLTKLLGFKGDKVDPNVARYLLNVSDDIRNKLFEGIEKGEIDTNGTLQSIQNAVQGIIKQTQTSGEEAAQAFIDLGNGMKYTKEQYQEMFGMGEDFDGVVDSVQEYGAALKSISSDVDAVDKAIQEYNKEGKISQSTVDSLTTANEDYAKAIEYTRDGIILKTEALKDLVKEYSNVHIAQLQHQLDLANEQKKRNEYAIQANEAASQYGLPGAASSQALLAQNETLKAQNAKLDENIKEWQGQIDYYTNLVNNIGNGDSGTEPPETKTKEFVKNTNVYNWTDAWLKDRQAEIDKLKDDYDKTNKQLDKAIELGDEEQIKILTSRSLEQSKAIRDKYAQIATQARDVELPKLYQQLYAIAPEFTGKLFDEISEAEWTALSKRLDDEVTRQENIGIAMYNADNTLENANKDSIETAKNTVQAAKDIKSALSDYFAAFGSKDGDGTYAENWAEQLSKDSDTIKSEFDALNDIFDKEVEKAQKETEKLDFRMDLLDEGDYVGKLDILTQKVKNNSDLQQKYADEIKKVEQAFKDSDLPAEDYTKRIDDLTDSYDECAKSAQSFKDEIEDIAKAQIDNITSVESNVMDYLESYIDLIEENKQKEIDAAEKTADAKKKALEKQKEALQDYQDELEKQWDAEDEREARREQLDERNKKATERAKTLAAASSGDLEALNRVKTLDEEIAQLDKEMQDDMEQRWRDDIKDYISDQMDELEKQSDKLDEQIDILNKQLEQEKLTNEELLKGESGYAAVHALMAGESVKIGGKDVDYDTMRNAVNTNSGITASYGYTQQTAEEAQQLKDAVMSLANLKSLDELAQGNFTLENGTIILADGSILDLNALARNSMSDSQATATPNFVSASTIGALATGAVGNLPLTAQQIGISEVLDKTNEIAGTIAEVLKNPTSFTVDNLLNVEGNMDDEILPMVLSALKEQLPNLLANISAKGTNKSAALIKWKR